MGYKSETQNKNLAWVLPRPKPDHYKGGMPLYCEDWLLELARDLLDNPEPQILNVFCGMNKQGLRVDLNPEVDPDIICDIHQLTSVLNERYMKELAGKFDIILADPPYSAEEAKELYGTPPLKYKVWTNECDKLLCKGGLLIVYHKYLMPNPNPEKYIVVKRVFIGGRPYHLPRIALYFQKKNA
ncbi:unnamed protein product [marine sediment metagenome]|uniref:Methyltransferase n=1 Tax=marine sediment metagenome TaxID=412755 RepID=X0SVW7_9ZZZZ